MYSTTYTGCKVANRKGLCEGICLRTQKNFVSKIFFKVSVHQPRNIMVLLTEECGLEEARNKNNRIIVSNTVLCNTIPPQLKVFECYKVTCGCLYQHYK